MSERSFLVDSVPTSDPIPVMLESPYSGDIELNVFYARLCLQDSCERGEAPFPTHLVYTQIPSGTYVSDDDAARRVMSREHGLQRGFVWRNLCKRTVFYVDEGMSSGMLRAEAEAIRGGHVVERRLLPRWQEIKAEWISSRG